MSRPKNSENFRLFIRNLNGRKVFYVRFLDEDGVIIATRSTGTSNERQAVKKALEIQKNLPKNPSIVDFLLDFWRREGAYARLKGINHALIGIRVALRWAFDKGYIPANPTLSFRNIDYKPQEKGA
jgi:hypothetical protein